MQNKTAHTSYCTLNLKHDVYKEKLPENTNMELQTWREFLVDFSFLFTWLFQHAVFFRSYTEQDLSTDFRLHITTCYRFEKRNTYMPYGFLTSWTGREAVREISVFHLTNSQQATHYSPIF